MPRWQFTFEDGTTEVGEGESHEQARMDAIRIHGNVRQNPGGITGGDVGDSFMGGVWGIPGSILGSIPHAPAAGRAVIEFFSPGQALARNLFLGQEGRAQYEEAQRLGDLEVANAIHGSIGAVTDPIIDWSNAGVDRARSSLSDQYYQDQEESSGAWNFDGQQHDLGAVARGTANSFVQSVPSMAAMIAATLATGGAGAAVGAGLEGAMGAGDMVEGIRDSMRSIAYDNPEVFRNSSVGRAALAQSGGNLDAAIEYASRMVSGNAPIAGAITSALSRVGGDWVGNLGLIKRNIIEGMLREASEEGLQSFQENLFSNQAMGQVDPSIGLFDNAVGATLQGAALGGVAGGFFGGVSNRFGTSPNTGGVTAIAPPSGTPGSPTPNPTSPTPNPTSPTNTGIPDTLNATPIGGGTEPPEDPTNPTSNPTSSQPPQTWQGFNITEPRNPEATNATGIGSVSNIASELERRIRTEQGAFGFEQDAPDDPILATNDEGQLPLRREVQQVPLFSTFNPLETIRKVDRQLAGEIEENALDAHHVGWNPNNTEVGQYLAQLAAQPHFALDGETDAEPIGIGWRTVDVFDEDYNNVREYISKNKPPEIRDSNTKYEELDPDPRLGIAPAERSAAAQAAPTAVVEPIPAPKPVSEPETAPEPVKPPTLEVDPLKDKATRGADNRVEKPQEDLKAQAATSAAAAAERATRLSALAAKTSRVTPIKIRDLTSKIDDPTKADQINAARRTIRIRQDAGIANEDEKDFYRLSEPRKPTPLKDISKPWKRARVEQKGVTEYTGVVSTKTQLVETDYAKKGEELQAVPGDMILSKSNGENYAVVDPEVMKETYDEVSPGKFVAKQGRIVDYYEAKEGEVIRSREGTRTARKGDKVLRDAKGEWVVPEDKFRNKYVELEKEPHQEARAARKAALAKTSSDAANKAMARKKPVVEEPAPVKEPVSAFKQAMDVLSKENEQDVNGLTVSYVAEDLEIIEPVLEKLKNNTALTDAESEILFSNSPERVLKSVASILDHLGNKQLASEIRAQIRDISNLWVAERESQRKDKEGVFSAEDETFSDEDRARANKTGEDYTDSGTAREVTEREQKAESELIEPNVPEQEQQPEFTAEQLAEDERVALILDKLRDGTMLSKEDASVVRKIFWSKDRPATEPPAIALLFKRSPAVNDAIEEARVARTGRAAKIVEQKKGDKRQEGFDEVPGEATKTKAPEKAIDEETAAREEIRLAAKAAEIAENAKALEDRTLATVLRLFASPGKEVRGIDMIGASNFDEALNEYHRWVERITKRNPALDQILTKLDKKIVKAISRAYKEEARLEPAKGTARTQVYDPKWAKEMQEAIRAAAACAAAEAAGAIGLATVIGAGVAATSAPPVVIAFNDHTRNEARRRNARAIITEERTLPQIALDEANALPFSEVALSDDELPPMAHDPDLDLIDDPEELGFQRQEGHPGFGPETATHYTDPAYLAGRGPVNYRAHYESTTTPEEDTTYDRVGKPPEWANIPIISIKNAEAVATAAEFRRALETLRAMELDRELRE